MSIIPTNCFRCGKPLGFTVDKPNRIEDNKPKLVWVCNKCFKKNNLSIGNDKEEKPTMAETHKLRHSRPFKDPIQKETTALSDVLKKCAGKYIPKVGNKEVNQDA